MNIYLTGFQGVGKTTCGRLLSVQMSKNFFDIDEELQKHFMADDIGQLYKDLGEKRFRDLEREEVLAISETKNAVIALGGGSLSTIECQKIFPKCGFLIYLYLEKKHLIDKLEKQCKNGQIPQYLDSNDPFGSFERLFEIRHAIFSKTCARLIPVKNRTREQIVQSICVEVR